MKIAIVHEFLTKIGGAEKVLKVLHEMFPEAPIYTLVYDEEGTHKEFSDCNIITSSLQKKPKVFRKNPKLLLPKLTRAIEEFDFSEYDVVISSSNSYAHGIITKPSTFHLCYCHSPIRYVWDWHSEYLTENNIGYGLKGLYVRSLLHKIRLWDYIASFRVDQWIANSKNVQNRIKKYYRADSIILPPPVDVDNIKIASTVPDDYYLIVSRLEPYKKIERVIDCFNKNKKELVIIGTGTCLYNFKKTANSNIEFLGWQSDNSVYEYMRNCKALIFPGEEDFGITPVESMAAGRPVIAYNKGGVTESVIEGKTGLFFDDSPDSLSFAIKKIDQDIIKYSPNTCREQALKFSKEKFVEKFTKIFQNEYEEYIKNLDKK